MEQVLMKRTRKHKKTQTKKGHGSGKYLQEMSWGNNIS